VDSASESKNLIPSNVSPKKMNLEQTTGSTGFRLDAIKHIDRKFMLNWVRF